MYSKRYNAKQKPMRVIATLKALSLQKVLKAGFLGALLLMLSFSTLTAQGWERSFDLIGADDQGGAVIETPDSGYVAIGSGFWYDGFRFFVLRFDVDGEKIWSKLYGCPFETDLGRSLTPLADGGFLLLGVSECDDANGRQAKLIRIDKDGNEVWPEHKLYGGADLEEVFDIIPTDDGNFVFVGRTRSFGDGENQVYLVKVDENGNTLFEKNIADTLDSQGEAIVQTQDGGFAIVGSAQNPINSNSKDVFLLKTDSDGNKLWSTYFGGVETDEGFDIEETPEGDLVLCGNTQSFGPTISPKAYMLKTDAQGTLLWSEYWSSGVSTRAKSLQLERNGDIIIGGTIEVDLDNSNYLLLNYSADGEKIFDRDYGPANRIDIAENLIITMDSSIVMIGQFIFIGQGSDFTSDFNVLKVDNEGNLYTHYITGHVFFDENLECDLDPNESRFENWILTARGLTNDHFFIADTDSNGLYTIAADTGTYELNLVIPNSLWETTICQPIDTLSLNTFYDTTYVDFPLHPKTDCPLLEVSVSSAFLRRCDTATYNIQFCNSGSILAEDAVLDLVLDDDLTYISSNWPNTPTQIGDTLFFDLGDVAVTDCHDFEVNVLHDCDGTLLGEAHCVSAHIFPDSFCLPADPLWDGSSIAVRGACEEDDGQVRFTIENVGDAAIPANSSLQFIVIEDDVQFLQAPIPPLQPEEELDTVLIATGKTYRLIADQSAFHPGNSNPTVAIEGCVVDTTQNYSVGYITQFPEDDGDFFRSIDCQENRFSFATNAKRGYPKGYDTIHHYISNLTDLEYTIVFQNVGTDTAFRVVIRDTLSPFVDPSTVQFLGSSHNSFLTNFEWTSSGILKIIFDGINLPDSTTNLNASIGHVSFKVTPFDDLPEETIINNTAAIYFDYNLPEYTNTTIHTISDSIGVITHVTPGYENTELGYNVKIYPNPFLETTTFEILVGNTNPKTVLLSQNRFILYDLAGRPLKQVSFDGPVFQFHRENLPPGLYTYRVQSKSGRLLNAGKIVIQ